MRQPMACGGCHKIWICFGIFFDINIAKVLYNLYNALSVNLK